MLFRVLLTISTGHDIWHSQHDRPGQTLAGCLRRESFCSGWRPLSVENASMGLGVLGWLVKPLEKGAF
jgi:hypothetical protein